MNYNGALWYMVSEAASIDESGGGGFVCRKKKTGRDFCIECGQLTLEMF